MKRIWKAALGLLAITTFCACQTSGTTSRGPGMLMDYYPQVAFVGGTDSFSTKAEPLKLGLIYEVDRGFVDRIDIKIDEEYFARSYIVERTNKGKFLLTVDISHLEAGEHSLRVIAHQGARLPRPVSGRTAKLPFVVIR
ncbi:hypothetical protein [Sulfuriroseicoccus oceanibius]|uniref:Lipoprotein n=1 Tax=Sulfuriroseicoccus oceanibius TaxID=2707525 RepID=A0A6B3L5C3_9BACT|nr:hypothetical protein [Sulfuriroseicoccus oceanibius]QQL44964.1 hypothetical protein G3M56_014025 [Sulfuriroseicoccus oceanibius]